MNLDSTATSLLAAAAALGFVHTLAGPDHYVPFIAMAKAGRWTRRRTLAVTLLCGLGHVGSSLVLAVLGAFAGAGFEAAAGRVDGLGDARAAIATWLLIVSGTLYAAWGLKHALRGAPHDHVHAHADGTVHSHRHDHAGAHAHAHVAPAAGVATPATPATSAARGARRLTPWLLFTIFVFGPCEPILPLILAPEVAGQRGLGLLVFAVFTATTLLAMTACVFFALRSIHVVPAPLRARVARFQHAIAGGMVLGCGVAMQLGL